MKATFQATWLAGKKYCRETFADGTRRYAVLAHCKAGGGRWQTLDARCVKICARIDEALPIATVSP